MLERARRLARAFGLVLARTAFRVGELERAPVRRGLRRVVVAAQIFDATAATAASKMAARRTAMVLMPMSRAEGIVEQARNA